jgi:hypothetical protein
MSKVKSDFLLDLATGDCLGAFKGIEPVPEEEGLVNVKYIPMNSFFKQQVIKAIPREAIKRIMSNTMTYTVILENSKGESPFLEKLLGMQRESINEMREKLSDKDFESRTAQYKAKESKESLDRIKQKERERSRQSNYPTFAGRTLFGQGGFPQQRPTSEIRELEDL